MAEHKKNTNPLKMKSNWQLKLLLFLLCPTLILFAGLSILDNAQKERYIDKVGQEVDAEFELMSQYADTEFFFAKSFQELIKLGNAQEIASAAINLRSEVGKDFDYLVWDGNLSLLASSISEKSFKGDWKAGWKTLSAYFTFRNKYTEVITKEERINIRKIFGPQYLVENCYDVNDTAKNKLVWPDTTKKHPLTWAYADPGFKVAFFVKYEALKKLSGVIAQIRKRNKSNLLYRFNLLEKGKILLPEIDGGLLSESQLAKISLEASPKLVLENCIVFSRIISEYSQALAVVPISKIPSQLPLPPFALALIFLICSYFLLAFKNTHKVITEPKKASISSKLALVFLIANGFPLSILLFLGFNYLEEKQFALMDEVHSNTVALIQNFDERFESEYFRKILRIKRGKKLLLPDLKRGDIPVTNFKKFLEVIGDNTILDRGFKVFLVASNTELMATRHGIFHGKEVEEFSGKFFVPRRPGKELEFFQKISQYFISSMNGQPMDELTATEVEVLAESIVQKSVPEILQEFLESLGKTTRFGIGSSKSPGYFDAISVSENNQTDYILATNWDDENTQIDYLNHQFLNLNRNRLNLKIIAMSPSSRHFFPNESSTNQQLISMVEGLSNKPSPPRKFIEFKGEKHLLVAMKGRHLSSFALFGLYPAQKIENAILTQKKILIFAGVLTLLLSIGLGQLLAISFLYPLGIISAGAKAIEQRQFDLRLPALGNDEFGEMAKIFNNSMVDLEELKVAGFIQDHLLPNEAINSGHFNLYGKSSSMGDLGGDYFDYFETSENKFSVLIGDVAGHGVGAALIMAMAKAGILLSEEILEQPAEILQKLHELILQSKTPNQKKIMTFQYLSLDGLNGTATYANAGGWSPLFFDKSKNELKEISLNAPVLGAFKKAVYNELELSFKAGDALILYTDGIVECQNPGGEILGFSRFKEMVANSYNLNAEVFYENILKDYHIHLAGETAQDDLTIIVLVFNP